MFGTFAVVTLLACVMVFAAAMLLAKAAVTLFMFVIWTLSKLMVVSLMLSGCLCLILMVFGLCLLGNCFYGLDAITLNMFSFSLVCCQLVDGLFLVFYCGDIALAFHVDIFLSN